MNDEKQSFEKLPDWDECCKFLTHRCEFLEGRSRAIIKGRAIDTQQRQKTNHMHLSKSFITTNASCTYCDSGSHYITQCKSFSALQLTQRKDFVRKAMLCFNCLRKSHVITDCSSKSRCKVCQGAHHTLLHANSPSPIKADSMTNQPQQSLVPEHADSNQHSRPRVSLIARTPKRGIIPTALVQIKDGHGDFQIVRALLDSGSEVNLITEETAKRLKLEKSRVSQSISGVSNTTQTVIYNVYTVLKSRVSEFKWCSHFDVIKRICNHQPSEPIDISQWDIPNGIVLADPNFDQSHRIDVLIGIEGFFEAIRSGKCEVGPGMPAFINTAFGWIVGGNATHLANSATYKCNLIQERMSLDECLDKFWEVEEYKTAPQRFSEEEQLREQHYSDNVALTSDATAVFMCGSPLKSNNTG
ncbi:uncharacterized protein [Drosophila takahashii]|uniref:uncharacterized protein n=1 Tax=Drosophila takahashii TaxID=29030 RepID=UPI0038992F48